MSGIIKDLTCSLIFLRHCKNILLSDFKRVFFLYLFHFPKYLYLEKHVQLCKLLILPLLLISLKQMMFSSLKWTFRVIRWTVNYNSSISSKGDLLNLLSCILLCMPLAYILPLGVIVEAIFLKFYLFGNKFNSLGHCLWFFWRVLEGSVIAWGESMVCFCHNENDKW